MFRSRELNPPTSKGNSAKFKRPLRELDPTISQSNQCQSPSQIKIKIRSRFLMLDAPGHRTRTAISIDTKLRSAPNTHHNGHRRHPRLCRPRHRLKPRVHRPRPSTTYAILGRRARRVRSPTMARAINGARNGSRPAAGTVPSKTAFPIFSQELRLLTPYTD